MPEPLCAPPSKLVRGDSFRVRIPLPSGFEVGWSPELNLVGPTVTSLSITVEDVDAQNSWLAVLSSSSSTDDLLVGVYSWSIRFLLDDERHTTASGQMEVTADPSELDESDERTFARKALDAIEAAILRKGDATSFSVDARSYTFPTHADLLNYRSRLRTELDAEEDERALEQGGSTRQTAWVRW